ncbi:MAG: endonuclease domain-containing protein [Candidatus Gastranaerophilaceae bacterium]|nr:endonuclease domain-containing protein [Candidatus Gastranaerophilaceae bacterium]
MKHKSTTLNQAKMLRKNMTEQEKVLWNLLRNNQFYGLKFRRQVPIGNYVADFVCEIHNVIIELDGGQHNEPENIEKDKQRTDFLESKGYKIIRFWNNEIDNNLEGACEVIYKTIFKKD